MPFMLYEEFKNTYLDIRTSNTRIGKGGYGSVYATEKHIVKVQDSFSGFIRELNICSSITHPCIISIEDWTYTSDNLYVFSQPKGMAIKDALKQGKISLCQTVCDIY